MSSKGVALNGDEFIFIEDDLHALVGCKIEEIEKTIKNNIEYDATIYLSEGVDDFVLQQDGSMYALCDDSSIVEVSSMKSNNNLNQNT